MDKKSIYLIFGGPSDESSISLNSARSVYDHLLPLENIHIILIYLSDKLECYTIDKLWIYCNTLDDFSFKLDSNKKTTLKKILLKAKNEQALIWPLLHGVFGEDGQIQKLLEEHQLPFIGSGSLTCEKLFRKSKALKFLSTYGLQPGPFLCLDNLLNKQPIADFLTQHSQALCKPDDGGSSQGVFTFDSLQYFNEAWEKNSKFYKNKILIEPFYTGVEFSIVVLEINKKAVSLVPSSIHYEKNTFYDFRKKYLPTTQATIQTPGKFSHEILEEIRKKAEHIFIESGAKDILRIDGWVLNKKKITFSDINICSGMEQNSLLFLQAAFCQISHYSLCRHLISKYIPKTKELLIHHEKKNTPIFILAGGVNAEKQVSLMSGTNVWLKLKAKYPERKINLFFINKNNRITQIEQDLALYHTCEEIEKKLLEIERSSHYQSLISDSQKKILENLQDIPKTIPNKLTHSQFTSLAQQEKAFIFLALHGGEGENGIWQKRLEKAELLFNGSGSQTSKVCMDKYQTGKIINTLNNPFLFSLEKMLFSINDEKLKKVEDFFKKYKRLIVKPVDDGCSTGVCLLENIQEFKLYVNFLKNSASIMPKETLPHLKEDLHLPNSKTILIEPYIEIEKITKKSEKNLTSGWIEMTYGLLENNDSYKILSGSQTLSANNILTLEEKFQNGTGTNITPCELITSADQKHIKNLMTIAAKALNIKNYARFDIFFHLKSKKVIFIEANTLPALTPSTVIFHQALIDKISPEIFLSMIIENASRKTQYLENN